MIVHESIHQGHEAWDEWRSVRATASEFGKIFTGGGKVSSQRESYMRSRAVARRYKVPPTFKGNWATERGHELEPIARQLFTELSGLDVREVACVEHDGGLCGGSPDGLIYASASDPIDKPISGLEIKAYNEAKHLGILDKGILPTENKPQVHGLMWLAGVSCWQYMPYHPDCLPFDHIVIETTPDQYTDNLMNEVLTFCEELDKRSEEFISDYEKRMEGKEMKEVMPALYRLIE